MDWQRRATEWTNERPRLIDGIVVAWVLFVGVMTSTLLPVKGSEAEANAFAYTLVIAAATVLWWRRSHPVIVLPVCALLTTMFWVSDFTGQIDHALWIAFFTATRHGGSDRHKLWQVVGVCLAGVLVVATIGVIVPTEDLPFQAVIGIFFIHGTAAAVGEALYQRAQHIHELEQRAADLEADLERKTALAAVEERTRIAREMHDIIAHGMSAIVVQAVAGQRVVDTNPDQAREVFTTIENIGRDSVDEMRRMLGVLRDGGDEAVLEPQPTFNDLDALKTVAAEAGVDVSVEVSGESRALPPGLELTAYRVVQEALTNVVRHAGRPVRAEVSIAYTDETLDISVVDDGLGAAASAQTSGTGHGLLGMRERVEIYRGRLTVGPRPGGGYQVSVSLPLPAKVSA